MSIQAQASVTHSEIAAFFERILVPSLGAREVPFLYHTPRFARYSPSRQYTSTVVLSITLTAGFYKSAAADGLSSAAACFLHRPWNLERSRLRHGTLVLASHASFDEHLTVGWNVSLAERLGLDLTDAVCIKGYKENPDRKIGLVAKFSQSVVLETLVKRLRVEYEGAGTLYDPAEAEGGVRVVQPEVKCLAIMNAFHAEEIERVLAAARDRDWIDPDENGSSVLYLTGAARDYGLEAAKQVSMPAFCVGHRECEEWGIRYLARELRKQWPLLSIVEVLEEEEVIKKEPRSELVAPVSSDTDVQQLRPAD